MQLEILHNDIIDDSGCFLLCLEPKNLKIFVVIKQEFIGRQLGMFEYEGVAELGAST